MKVAIVPSLLLASSSVFAFSPRPSFRHSNPRQLSLDLSRRPILHDGVKAHRPKTPPFSVVLAAAAEKSNEGATSVLERPEMTEAIAAEVPVETTAVATTSTLAKSSDDEDVCVVEEEMTETQKLMQQVKDAGVAGVISYALWELGFWAVSVPVVIFGYYAAVGHFPDLSDKNDLAKLGAEAFAFVNFARFAVPLRIGLALSTTPWIQSNIVDKYFKNEETVCEEPVVAEGDANGAAADVPEEAPLVEKSPKRVRRWRSFLPFGRQKNT